MSVIEEIRHLKEEKNAVILHTMECSCHKRIVIRSVAEYYKLGTA